jgi:predicted DNA-binding transcriptional regulator AlpA
MPSRAEAASNMVTSDTELSRRSLLRWLLRELSTDDEDMIAFIRSLDDSDEDDAQLLLEALAVPPAEPAVAGPLEADYQTESQLLDPAATLRLLDLPRATFYALVKRGTFPRPVALDDVWKGWPRGLVVEWADPALRKRLSATSSSGYAPFERVTALPADAGENAKPFRR